MKYYAVRNKDSEDRENDDIWTVSTNPDEEGWYTDLGAKGYGLMKDQAEFLAAAGNEKLAREELLEWLR